MAGQVATGTTTNAFTRVLAYDTLAHQGPVLVKNTGATNSMDVEVRGFPYRAQGSQTAPTLYRLILRRAVPVTDGQNILLVDVNVAFGDIQVLVRSSGAGSSTTYRVEAP